MSSSMLSAQSWLVVGDVLNASKPASSIVSHLLSHGKTVHSFNPRFKPTDSPLPSHFLPSLSSLPASTNIDVVDLVVNPVDGLKTVKELTEGRGVKNVFIQPGAGSEEILKYCEEKGVKVHQGCVLMELK